METELPGLGIGGGSGPAYVLLGSMPDAGGKDSSASGSVPTFNLSSDSSSDSDNSVPPSFAPTSHPAPSSSCLTAPGTHTAPNAGTSHPASSCIPLPSALPAPDDDAASTPRSTPDAPSNLRCSTRARKPPVEFWKLPKDRQPTPAPVPDASDEDGPSGSDADTAVHLANCTASRALSE